MEGKEWNREAKAAWVSSKKAGKAIVKALWWSIIIITACYGLGRGIGQGVTDKLADNGKITVLTIFESQKQEEAGGRKEAYE